MYDVEKAEIEQNLLKFSNLMSNLEKCVDLALRFEVELPLKWLSADYHTKLGISLIVTHSLRVKMAA